MKFALSTSAGCIAATLTLLAFDASAATIRVQCEQRGTQRSNVSVDGKDLPALPAGQMYSASIVSGGNSAASIGRPLVRGEVEFDFDSNPADIAAGATAIAPTFISGGSVSANIVHPNGGTVLSATAACRVRSR
jgi:hypothetical protein